MKFTLFLLATTSAICGAATETRLMRYPDISRVAIVFDYAGDLWTAPRAGGQARRLTAHPGDELYPKFSPDGKWIAFTGEYDGNSDPFGGYRAGRWQLRGGECRGKHRFVLGGSRWRRELRDCNFVPL